MALLQYTPLGEIEKVHARLHQTFHSGIARPLAYRRKQLYQFARMFQENHEALQRALYEDLGRTKVDATVSEIASLVNGAFKAAEKLEEWSEPEKMQVDQDWKKGLDVTMIPVPKGAVCIIAPWNFPFATLLFPFLGAIAAGCTVVLKPSELSAASAHILSVLMPKYLDPASYAVINGAVPETTKLLDLKWNHIFYTGGAKVGRIVAEKAARWVCPVTLELGGKSPVYVDEGLDLDVVAKRLLWGKSQNAGQLCVAPDYVLVPLHLQTALVTSLKKAYGSFYPFPLGALDSQSNLGKIINEGHYDRLLTLIGRTKGDVIIGGKPGEGRRIDVTIVSDVKKGDSLMEDELFGPILPIVPVNGIDEAIAFIRDGPTGTPLALYVFTENEHAKQKFLLESNSGTIVFNDTFQQLAVDEIPLGGQGESGYGGYQGKHSFDMFVHRRGYINMPFAAEPSLAMRYPPHTEETYKFFAAAFDRPIPES